MIFSPLEVKIVTLVYFVCVNQVFLVRYDVNGIFQEKVAYLYTDSNNKLYCCRLPLSMCFLFKCHCNQLTWGTVAMKVSWLTAVTSNWPRLFVNRTLNDTGYCFYSCWTLFLLFTLSYFQLHFNESTRRNYVFQILCNKTTM